VISIVIVSKDEASLDVTLADVTAQAADLGECCEVVVVDASCGRLDHIRRRHAGRVRWTAFRQPQGVAVSIPHQRNAGVRAAKGEIIVFTDAGCRPDPGWLARIVAPLRHGEQVTCGLALSVPGTDPLYDRGARRAHQARYLAECPTVNLAFRRGAFDAVGGFDERFSYGSDVDFSWRLTDAGYRIHGVPHAVIRHDPGTRRRQLRRSYVYGQARMRLYRKHRARLRHVLRRDPMVVAYPAFLLGAPLAMALPVRAVFRFGWPASLAFPLYLALLIVPAWRNRSDGAVRVLTDHLAFGAGALAELVGR
jgi:glycosyltransferase involved in cell wall biosynthesis